MYKVDNANRMIGFAVTTAMAGVLLAGCATNAAPRAEVSVQEAQVAMAEGKHDRAVRAAEAAVMADPRNASYRAVLANAYLDAGRFASAETSFNDAMALGDNSARTALSLALTLTAQAKFADAAALLNDWEGEIAAADLGLALALSGQPERGIHIMGNAIRGGQNTVKMRQNLAYAYALAGRWREARLTAAQDVPADQLGDRMALWAELNSPLAYQLRVARLLDVPAGMQDRGQPVELALANHPGADQLAAEAIAPRAAAPAVAAIERVPVPASGAELPSVAQTQVAANEFTQAFTHSEGSISQDSPLFVRQPVVQTMTASQAVTPRISGQVRPIATRAIPTTSQVSQADSPSTPVATRRSNAHTARMASDASQEAGTHLVQLGSFASEQGARRAWGIYVARYPELADHDMVITRAVVRGKNYWRVSAGGFSRAGSRAMCSSSSANGGDGCIAWAANSPLPGAVDSGLRLASR